MNIVAAAVLAVACLAPAAPAGTPPDSACGSWLELESASPGYVIIKVIDPHITCGTHPIKSVAVDPPATAVFFFDSNKKRFLVAAPAGSYTVTYYEDCPPCCSTCATLSFRVPAPPPDDARWGE